MCIGFGVGTGDGNQCSGPKRFLGQMVLEALPHRIHLPDVALGAPVFDFIADRLKSAAYGNRECD